jgi:predicted nucleic acid-binding protein
MASVIILDANVLIAYLDSEDAHHSRAVAALERYAGEGFGASVLTVAEALVHPSRHGREERVTSVLNDIGLRVLPLQAEDAVPLARTRATFGVRMPDAVALHCAMAQRGLLATFDKALTRAARSAGVAVAGELPFTDSPGA